MNPLKLWEIMNFFFVLLRKGVNLFMNLEPRELCFGTKVLLSTRDSQGIKEKNLLFEKYRNPKKIIEFYQKNISSELFDPNIDSFLDLGIRSLCYFPQFASNAPHFDFKLAKNCFEQYLDIPIFKHNLCSLDQVSKLSSHDNEDPHFLWFARKSSSEYELKQVAPTYLKKVGMEKFHGEYREKFVFNSRKFFESLFSHLPIQDLTQYTKFVIFGFNERGNTSWKVPRQSRTQ